MGFIFYPKSKRFVEDDFQMPTVSSEIKKVGVFVNDTLENISNKVKKHKLDFVQLHGDESVDITSKVFKTFDVMGVGIIKAFGIDEQFDFSLLKEYEDYSSYFLFDAKTSEYGGSGRKFDWDVLKNYKSSKLFFLSGGIDLIDIPLLADHYTNLFAVDVNSKFEIQPGLKDINKLTLLKNELSGK